MPTASGAREPGRGSRSLPSPLAPNWRWRRVFPGHRQELSELRRWLRSLLPECPARDDVLSVANELASNAIQHTASGRDGWFAVEVTWPGQVVRVAVADEGAPDGPRIAGTPTDEHGRGLVVVAGLSAQTGVCGGLRGRLVWAEVPWEDAGAPAPGSSRDPYESVIGNGEASLAGRFAEVPAWFGRATLQWWALARGGLVSAPSAQELASLLGRLEGSLPPGSPGGNTAGSEERGTTRAHGARQRVASKGQEGRGLAWIRSVTAHRARWRATVAARIA
jgi:anti-sigma regulatory factor (Ser/Thr protein kinase)